MKALVCHQFGPLDRRVPSLRVSFEDAVQGLQRLARREVRGKVVVTFKDKGLPAR
ncbi:MAG: hypothetical protein AB7E59_12435 [Pusillimonas sp.]